MKKPKIVLIIGGYLILLNIFALPAFAKYSMSYKYDISPLEFLYIVVYWLLSIDIICKIITGIGLVFFREWARIFAIVLNIIAIPLGLMNIYSNLLHGPDKSLTFYILAIFIDVFIIFMLLRPSVKKAMV